MGVQPGISVSVSAVRNLVGFHGPTTIGVVGVNEGFDETGENELIKIAVNNNPTITEGAKWSSCHFHVDERGQIVSSGAVRGFGGGQRPLERVEIPFSLGDVITAVWEAQANRR